MTKLSTASMAEKKGPWVEDWRQKAKPGSLSLREKYSNLEFFWSVLSRTQTEDGDLQIIRLILSKCENMRTKISPNLVTFHVVINF